MGDYVNWQGLQLVLQMLSAAPCPTLNEYVVPPSEFGWAIERSVSSCAPSTLCYTATKGRNAHKSCAPIENIDAYEAFEEMDKAFDGWTNEETEGTDEEFLASITSAHARMGRFLALEAASVEDELEMARQAIEEAENERRAQRCAEEGGSYCVDQDANSQN